MDSHNHLSTRRMMKRVLVYVVVWLLACLSPTRVVESSDQCKAWLVQSIPTDMPELPRISGVLSTGSSLLLAFQQLYYYLLCFLSTKICLLSIVSSVFYVSFVFVDFGNLVRLLQRQFVRGNCWCVQGMCFSG